MTTVGGFDTDAVRVRAIAAIDRLFRPSAEAVSYIHREVHSTMCSREKLQLFTTIKETKFNVKTLLRLCVLDVFYEKKNVNISLY